jgi:hypothetical protein
VCAASYLYLGFSHLAHPAVTYPFVHGSVLTVDVFAFIGDVRLPNTYTPDIRNLAALLVTLLHIHSVLDVFLLSVDAVHIEHTTFSSPRFHRTKVCLQILSLGVTLLINCVQNQGYST